MCMSIENSGSYTTVRKVKNDGNVEVASVAPWAKKDILAALRFCGNHGPATIKIGGYTVRSTTDREYVSLKDRDGIVFIPFWELGSVINEFAKAIES